MRSWIIFGEIYGTNTCQIELFEDGEVKQTRVLMGFIDTEEKRLFEEMEIRRIIAKKIVNAVILQIINEFGEVFTWLIQIEPFEIFEINITTGRKPVVLNDEAEISVYGSIYLYVRTEWRTIEFETREGVLVWDEAKARWYECGKQN